MKDRHTGTRLWYGETRSHRSNHSSPVTTTTGYPDIHFRRRRVGLTGDDFETDVGPPHRPQRTRCLVHPRDGRVRPDVDGFRTDTWVRRTTTTPDPSPFSGREDPRRRRWVQHRCLGPQGRESPRDQVWVRRSTRTFVPRASSGWEGPCRRRWVQHRHLGP